MQFCPSYVLPLHIMCCIHMDSQASQLNKKKQKFLLIKLIFEQEQVPHEHHWGSQNRQRWGCPLLPAAVGSEINFSFCLNVANSFQMMLL